MIDQGLEWFDQRQMVRVSFEMDRIQPQRSLLPVNYRQQISMCPSDFRQVRSSILIGMVCFQCPSSNLLNFYEVYSLMPLNSLRSYTLCPIITKSQSLYIFRKLFPLGVICVHFTQYSLKLSILISLFSLISCIQVRSTPRQKGPSFIFGMTISLKSRKVVMESCRICNYFSFRQPYMSCSSRSLATLLRYSSILAK